MPKRKLRNRPKIPDVLELLKEHIEEHRILDTRHSNTRKLERGVTWNHIVYVLSTGYREYRKDEWKEEYDSWNYAIRGKTIDGVELRIPVFFIDDRESNETFFGIATVVKIGEL